MRTKKKSSRSSKGAGSASAAKAPADLVRTVLRGELKLHHDIGFNPIVAQLLSQGPSVLNDIEKVLETPAVQSAIEQGGESSASRAGLANILQAYFLLAAKYSYPNLPTFFLALHGQFREEAVRRLLFLWGPVQAAREAAFPRGLRNALVQLSRLGSVAERKLSSRLVTYLTSTENVSSNSERLAKTSR